MSGVQGAVPPEGESPECVDDGGGHNPNPDDDSMAGAVENAKRVENDLRDIVMLRQAEERMATRQSQ